MDFGKRLGWHFDSVQDRCGTKSGLETGVCHRPIPKLLVGSFVNKRVDACKLDGMVMWKWKCNSVDESGTTLLLLLIDRWMLFCLHAVTWFARPSGRKPIKKKSWEIIIWPFLSITGISNFSQQYHFSSLNHRWTPSTACAHNWAHHCRSSILLVNLGLTLISVTLTRRPVNYLLTSDDGSRTNNEWKKGRERKIL